MSNLIDETGNRYGMLVVRERDRTRRPAAYWLCRCDCGRDCVARGRELRSGRDDCGCRARQKQARARTTHGAYGTTEYNIWSGILDRCCNPNAPAFRWYGGRGIAVCDEWRASFRAFLDAVGRRPSAGHSIDRIDNDRGYEVGNVRWATRREQAQNRRCTVRVSRDGETLCITEMARRHGMNPATLIERVQKYGWDVARALTEPVRAKKLDASDVARIRELSTAGVSRAELGRQFGVSSVMVSRIALGKAHRQYGEVDDGSREGVRR